jgi:hypothetical protein
MAPPTAFTARPGLRRTARPRPSSWLIATPYFSASPSCSEGTLILPGDLSTSRTRRAPVLATRSKPIWHRLCAEVGCSLDTIPFIESVVDRHRVRATYNAGYSVVRRENAVLELAAYIFTRSAERDLRPRRGASTQVFASTGWVGTVANEYWGSSQAVMSVAIWSTGQRVKQLDARYNVPLHLLADQEALSEEWCRINPVHVHYHGLFSPKHWPRPLNLLRALGTQEDRLDWLLSMPLSGAECPT